MFHGEVDNGCRAVLKTVAPMGLQVRILSSPQKLTLESWQSGNAADC